ADARAGDPRIRERLTLTGVGTCHGGCRQNLPRPYPGAGAPPGSLPQGRGSSVIQPGGIRGRPPDRVARGLPHQHQTPRVENGIQYGDLLKYVDFQYVARAAALNAATLAALAYAPPAPTNVRILTKA